MAHNSIIKDPDNKFWVGINWASWVNDQQKETGGVITITGSAWPVVTGLLIEVETPTTVINDITYLIASGGVIDTTHLVTNRITYLLVVGSLSVSLTQDASFNITIKEQ